MYQIIRFLYKARFGWLFRLEVTGHENIPKRGGVLICFSHWDFLDAFIMMFSVRRSMKAFVASSYLWTPVVFPFWLAGHAVGVKRGKRDKKAMKLALKALREGFVFAVSPQGTRSRNGKLGEAKFGPAYLAGTTNVPVVPVAIIGSKGGLKDVLMLRRPKVQIVFGKPFHLDMDWTKLINGAGDPAVKAYCAEVVEQQIMPKIRQLHAVHGSVK